MNDKAKNYKIVIVAVLIFIVLLFIALTINLVRLSRASSREKALAAELERLHTRYENGEEEIGEKSSRDYITRYAKEYLNMKDKDETAFTGE